MKPEELKPEARVGNLVLGQLVTIIYVNKTNDNVASVGYRREDGGIHERVLYPEDLASLELVCEPQHPFDADGRLFRLIAEAWRLRNAHLFDPYSALHSARIRPLPHQITAVYGEMLPRLQLRFLLADDPGAGKTIMTGLYIRELIARSALRRCLICVPPSLALQWQQEMQEKFDLKFTIPERLDSARNPFFNNPFLIVSMDTLKKKPHRERLKGTEVNWDLIVCDEAHKMAAHYDGDDISYTDRYHLGETLADLADNLLLLTATPHNGKQEEYELFLRLLDRDRFWRRAGRTDSNGAQEARDRPDYMRRMVKEDLRDFNGKKLFPERRATTLSYELPADEEELYRDVTNYVREEFNRAERLASGKRHSVGFALTILQRRLASSPLAIQRSLVRRRKLLEDQLQTPSRAFAPPMREEDGDHEEHASENDGHHSVGATAARSPDELRREIASLHKLERTATQLCRSGVDRKWVELNDLLQDPLMRRAEKRRRHKLVIFTEYRDTQEYLVRRLREVPGLGKEVVEIHGGVDQPERLRIQLRFNQEPGPSILVATDAAAEGINLQSAHLMINYDLPWNPNRLEQRFGRIHRINQKEVCHLWNLVASNTREGAVFQRLEEKIRVIGDTLSLFDVLGEELPGVSLRALMVDALRYNETPEVRAQLEQSVDDFFEKTRRERELLKNVLVPNVMDLRSINQVSDDLLRQETSRLHPHFVRNFLRQALPCHNALLRSHGKGRYQIPRVPYNIRRHAPEDQELEERYRRLYFDAADVETANDADAELLYPAHPLVHAVSELMLEERKLLRRGTLLVDETDSIDEPMAVFTVRLAIRNGNEEVVGGEAHFISVDRNGEARLVGQPPWLEFRPATDAERERAQDLLNEDWLMKEELTNTAERFAREHQARALLDQTRSRQQDRISREREQVRATLKQRIQHEEENVILERQNEENERDDGRRNLAGARRIQAENRRDEHQQRLDFRLEELGLQEHLSVQPPIIVGAVLVLPQHMTTHASKALAPSLRERQCLAIKRVLETELALGNEAKDLSHERHGFDIESRNANGTLHFIRARSYDEGARHIVLTQNELVAALNVPGRFILALVKVQDGNASVPRYLRRFPEQVMDDVNVSIPLENLLSKCEKPADIS